MKLRNKKTGEIGNLVLNINQNRESYAVLSTENGDTICGNLVLADYDTLAGLNEEWEDYEEPKSGIKDVWFPDVIEGENNVVISFETKEEAEQAVEKLKAWKRLKDKGLRFNTWYGGSKNISYEITSLENEMYIPREIGDDLDLLFGGEE